MTHINTASEYRHASLNLDNVDVLDKSNSENHVFFLKKISSFVAIS